MKNSKSSLYCVFVGLLSWWFWGFVFFKEEIIASATTCSNEVLPMLQPYK